MRKEYPPMLYGTPEEQLPQMRAYLVRLIGYIDEAINEAAKGNNPVDADKLTAWQEDTDGAIGALRTAARQAPLLQYGTAEAGDVVFPRSYADTPVVISTAGTVSNVSGTGFSLSSGAQWIAVGRR